jgi:hypothetical protein
MELVSYMLSRALINDTNKARHTVSRKRSMLARAQTVGESGVTTKQK